MEKIIELKDVNKFFTVGGGFFNPKKTLRVLENLNLSIRKGEILCLVGESGCGKTTTGKLIAGLIKPTSGEILFYGKDIWKMDKTEFKNYRRSVQIVHQDPYSSLNPVKTIYDILSAPLLKHHIVSSNGICEEKISELLKIVGLTPAEDFIYKYPHQLSGGQRQRVVIARALTLNPEFIVADEAVSMLDVSIRLSIIKLLLSLKENFNMTFLFITHDLAMAKYFGWNGKIAVMYLGRIVEMGPTPRVLENPLHPYTKALLLAVPEADPEVTRNKKVMELRSLDLPSLLNLPPGCRFSNRCPYMEPGKCDKVEPNLYEVEKEHYVACELYGREV
ncbi:MAG: ABC transporter ATP-binding protein [Dictyoglomus sp.]|uniref:ABC transporter ATP-binding protein n=1 Tax=Dictyoglomus sp. TaxID=28205 RepID=UPI003D0DC47C